MESKDSLYCLECGGLIDFSFGLTLMSYSPKYQHSCKDCGSLRVYTEEEERQALLELRNE